ncbi:pilus assembly protein PilM, partial [Anaerococcus vaginalis]
RPVIDKIISIIENASKDQKIDKIVLVGGTALLSGMEDYVGQKTKIKTLKPSNPMFVTPIGIALSLIED